MAKYRFSDIFNEKMYDTAQVIVVTGPYSIFSNIVCDRFRDMCKGKIALNDDVNEVFDEFGLEKLSDADQSNAISVDMFFDVARTPPLSGKWYCRVDWKELTKKQRGRVESYLKKPSSYGCLVITVSDYSDYKGMLKSRVLINSQVAHLIQLSFPSRKVLPTIVSMELAKYGATAYKDAIQTFILRMSSAYDDYQDALSQIASIYGYHKITKEDMAEYLKGVENYVLDDFVKQLTVPVNNTRVMNNRKIVRMLRVMLNEYGAVELVKKLRYKVNDAIQMRMLINRGIVPVRVRYSVDEAKSKMEDGDRLKGMNDYSFKRLAQLASLTSLRDWLFMRLILSTPKTAFDEAEHERALYALVNRTAFSENRIYNVIGVLDNLEIMPELYRMMGQGAEYQKEQELKEFGREKMIKALETKGKTKKDMVGASDKDKKEQTPKGASLKQELVMLINAVEGMKNTAVGGS